VARHIQTDIPKLDREAELVVYRVAQEGLTNVARHAGSDTAELALASEADQLKLTVRDYGRGLPNGNASDGTGVRGMRERAALIGADLTIGRARDGVGTELLLEVPLRGTS
jgi:two-component system sensor histidine kinase UhpB